MDSRFLLHYTDEGIMRKLDSQGRVVIPKTLREKLNIEDNASMYFSTAVMDGKNYVLVTDNVQYAISKNDVDVAIHVLEELGERVPQLLYDIRNR